jgi:hypothetical protein
VFKEFQESSLALGLSCNFSALESWLSWLR